MSSVQRICPHCQQAYPIELDNCTCCGRPAVAAVVPQLRGRSTVTSTAIAAAAAPLALAAIKVTARFGLSVGRALLKQAFGRR
jgi:predicted amidophosphoribosyltransferase